MMKLALILLCLQITILKASPFDRAALSEAPKDVAYSEDSWKYNFVHDTSEINGNNCGNGGFIGATSAINDSENFWDDGKFFFITHS